MHGTRQGAGLKPLHVTRWLDSHPGWKGSRRNAVVAVKRAFNWADAEGLLQPNPVKYVKKPPQGRRIRVLTPEERKGLLAAIPDRRFREFVFALLETGARPGKVRKVTAAQVNLDLGVWVFDEHKTAKKTGRPRVIYLTPAMVDLCRRLVQQYPEGPLFRGPRSKRGYTAVTASASVSATCGRSICSYKALSATRCDTVTPPRPWSTASTQPTSLNFSAMSEPKCYSSTTPTWPRTCST